MPVVLTHAELLIDAFLFFLSYFIFNLLFFSDCCLIILNMCFCHMGSHLLFLGAIFDFLPLTHICGFKQTKNKELHMMPGTMIIAAITRINETGQLV